MNEEVRDEPESIRARAVRDLREDIGKPLWLVSLLAIDALMATIAASQIGTSAQGRILWAAIGAAGGGLGLMSLLGLLALIRTPLRQLKELRSSYAQHLNADGPDVVGRVVVDLLDDIDVMIDDRDNLDAESEIRWITESRGALSALNPQHSEFIFGALPPPHVLVKDGRREKYMRECRDRIRLLIDDG